MTYTLIKVNIVSILALTYVTQELYLLLYSLLLLLYIFTIPLS